jgi:hypothetical protein
MFLSPTNAQRDQKDVKYPGSPLSPGSNKIRLIRLLDGEWTTPLRCELFEDWLMPPNHESLEDKPHITRYHALSYVWGSKHATRPILLNGMMFPVTANLEGALRHLRELYREGRRDLVLWVDALCINQDDVEERTEQVQLMGHIYAHCEEVIAYLGDRLGGKASSAIPSKAVIYGQSEHECTNIPREERQIRRARGIRHIPKTSQYEASASNPGILRICPGCGGRQSRESLPHSRKGPSNRSGPENDATSLHTMVV